MWQFEAIGTKWSIETPNDLSQDTRAAIEELIENFDKTYSRFREDSLITKISRHAGTYTFPDDAAELIGLYRRLYRATDGAMSPLIGASLSNLGYDKDYSLQMKESVHVPRWESSLDWNGTTVTAHQPVLLDFGAVGKGYLVDLIAIELESQGVRTYTIDASGDIRHRGNEYQTVGLENPHDESRVIGIMSIKNQSLCASSTNRRRWGKHLHHVIDGRTGMPTNDILSTWVISSSTAMADGLATALFFVGPEKLEDWDFQYVRLHTNGKIEHSEGFVGELFI